MGPRRRPRHRPPTRYFFTNPRLECSDERYAWVNTTMFVGEGRLVAGPAVEYRVYRLEN